MKRKILCGILTIGAYFTAQGQSGSIINPGFESWVQKGVFSDPAGWGTLNFLKTYGFPETAFQSTDACEGSYAIRLETKTYQGGADTIAGWAFTGEYGPIGPVFGAPYIQRPTGLSGYYKYSFQAKDSCSVSVYLTRWNTALNTRDTIGYANFIGNAQVASYTRFSVPIDYSSSLTPDSATIMLISSAGALQQNIKGVPGSVLFVDNLSFEGEVTGIRSYKEPGKANAYPNPAGNYISLILPNNAARLRIFNISGENMGEYAIGKNSSFIRPDITDFPEGLYLYEIVDINNQRLIADRFQVIK
jgi:hypothetical protein